MLHVPDLTPVLRALLLAVATLAVPMRAAAVTADELIELRRSGLGDDVLIALIETTGMSAAVGADTVLRMRDSGLSDRVIAAAVRAVPPPAPAAPAVAPVEPASNIAVIGYGSQDSAPAAYVLEREVVYVPWVIPVHGRPGKAHPAKPYFQGEKTFGRFINDGFIDTTRRHHRARRR